MSKAVQLVHLLVVTVFFNYWKILSSCTTEEMVTLRAMRRTTHQLVTIKEREPYNLF